MYPTIHAHWDVRRKDLDFDRLRELVAQWREVAPNYLGDYYPLTPYSTTNDVWMAWQFDRAESGVGMVQVFRRAQSLYESARLKLRGLDPGARYTLTNLDLPGETAATGRELMETGLLVSLRSHPDSAIIVYKCRLANVRTGH
jgi:alpha-galactosidase